MGRAQIDMKIFKLRQPIIYSFFSAPSNRCRRRWWVMQCVEVFGSWWYPCFKVTSFRAVSGVCSIQNRSGTHCSYPSEKSFVKECGSFFLAVTVQACTSVERDSEGWIQVYTIQRLDTPSYWFFVSRVDLIKRTEQFARIWAKNWPL